MSEAWGDFDGPTHQDELMAAHGGQPTIAEQEVTHGAGMPAVDLGQADDVKYGGCAP